jgi:sec-independent protein translocase protein TatB
MFDVGGGELLLVLVLVLVVLGPERLPEVARTVGRLTGRAKALFNNLRYELERESYNKELQEKFDEQMRKMGIDPDSLRQAGQTPAELVKNSPAGQLNDDLTEKKHGDAPYAHSNTSGNGNPSSNHSQDDSSGKDNARSLSDDHRPSDHDKPNT